jgi:hypothetical protein
MLHRLRRIGLHKNAVGLTPFVRFRSTTFGAGAVATQRPITCPKRQLPKYVMRNAILTFLESSVY